MHLNVFASKNCFVHCRGCYSFSREEEDGKHITTDKLIEFLEYAYSEGIKKVTLCGGDPLAREDIIEVLKKIKTIGFNISLDTVGSPIIKDIVSDRGQIVKKIDAKQIADNVDVIGIPIDGSNNEIFRRFRQTQADIVNEQLAVCERLHKAGANICINTVAHKGNLEDANELAKLIRKLDYINKWQIFQYEPLGKFGAMNREIFEITDKQFLDFKSKVLKVFEGDTSKLQFKSYHDRKNVYMLIDNSGNAWIPSDKIMSLSKFSYVLDGTIIIGNVNNPEDWSTICSYLDKDFGKMDKSPQISRDKSEERTRFINIISNNGEYRNLLSFEKKLEQTQIEELGKKEQLKRGEDR